MINKTVSSINQIALPIIQQGQVNFVFSTNINNGKFSFNFRFINNFWRIYVVMPDGTLRRAGCYNKTVSWSEFPDYSLLISTTGDPDNISYGDFILGNISMYLVVWA